VPRSASWFLSFLRHTEEKQQTARLLKELLQPYQAQTSSILDLGCGDGSFSASVLAGFGPTVAYTAIDAEKSLLDAAQKNIRHIGLGRSHFIHHHWLDGLAQLEEKFDLILASHIGYYSEDIVHFMAEIKRHLAPNGSAILIHETKEAFPNRMRKRYQAPIITDVPESLAPCAEEYVIESWITPARSDWKKILCAPYNQLQAGDKQSRDLLEFCVQLSAEDLADQERLDDYIAQIEKEYAQYAGRFYLPSKIQMIKSIADN